MRLSFSIKKPNYIMGILLLSILIGLQIISVNSLSVPNSENVAENDQSIMDFSKTSIPNNDILKPSYFDGDTVFGEGLRVTPSSLPENGYSIARDKDGRFHCIWVERITSYGASLFYSYTNDTLGMDWSISEPIFRTVEESIQNPILIIDNQKTLHIILLIQKSPYDYLYYLTKEFDEPKANFERFYNSKDYSLRSLSAILTNNDTLNIAWVSTNEDTSTHGDISNIQMTRLNITSKNWLAKPWNLFNSSDPLKVDITGDNESIKMCWTTSPTYNFSQEIYYSCYNESTITWSPVTSITSSSHDIKFLNIENSYDGCHVLWIEASVYYPLYYLKTATNGSVLNFTSRINNEDQTCMFAEILEEQTTGDYHLFFTDRNSTNSFINYRTKFGSNDTWDDIAKLTYSGKSSEPKIMLSLNDTVKVNLFYKDKGSISGRYLNISGNWSDIFDVHYAPQQTYYSSSVIDSEGTIHLVNYHYYSSSHEILYQRRLLNESIWTDIETLSVISGVTNPKLIIDENDTLYCFASSYDPYSENVGIYYIYKYKHQDNWSLPQLTFEPIRDVVNTDELVVLFDNDGIMHLFYTQYDYSHPDYYSQLYYCYKLSNSTTFSIPELMPNSQPNTHAYMPYAMIAVDGTIHLAYGEYEQLSVDSYITSIIYRSLEKGEDWSTLEVMSTSYDALFKPKLIQDSTSKIKLIYTINEVFSLWRAYYYSDFVLFEKMPEDETWDYKGVILADCVTAWCYDIIELPNDDLCFVYYDGEYVGTWWRNLDLEKLTVRIRTSNDEWQTGSELIAIGEDKTVPLGLYNPVSDEISVVFDYLGKTSWFNLQNDTDGDGLGDYDEYMFLTDLLETDTDSDGLTDGNEVGEIYSDPNMNDTDWDGIIDGDEVLIYGSDPDNVDTDRDNIEDGDEVFLYGSNPISQDSDEDGLDDYLEIIILGSNPLSNDTDSDLMPDKWEYDNNLNLLVDDSGDDEDNDRLTNLGEYLNGTDVYNPDTDSDYLTDGEEVLDYGTNPLNADSDYDTLTDWEELMEYHTDPLKEDTDDDGFTDREEISEGTDPNDPNDNIRRRKLKSTLLISLIPVTLIIAIVVSFEVTFRVKYRRLTVDETKELEKELQEYNELIKNDENAT